MSKSIKNYGADRSLAQEEPFEAPELAAESEIYSEIDDLYSQRYVALQGERMAAVKAAAQRTYKTFRYSKGWSVEGHTDVKQEAIDNKALLRFTSNFFLTFYMLVVTKCFSVYEGRLEQDTDEAHFERGCYERLKASIDVDAYAAESVEHSAKRFYQRWLRSSSLDQATEVAGEIINLVDDYVVAAAFSSLVDEVPIDASHKVWNAAFKKSIPKQSDGAFRFFYVTFVDQKADDLVNHLNPTEMPFEELRTWAGITWFEGRVFKDSGFVSYGLPDSGRGRGIARALSMQLVQAVDRAARQLETWDFKSESGPAFLDPNSGHRVTYHEEGLPLVMAQTAVEAMSARTADVWRLTTALILAHWHEGASEPPSVWIDARKLCDAMGFKKHKHGGHRPENVAVVVTALRDLTRFHIELALGSTVYPKNPVTGKRTATRVIGRRISELLLVNDIKEVTFLVDNERLPLRWEIAAGGWIKDFPRQFAPLFKSLVELPGRNKTDLWAKALGMELTWQYRQDGGKTKVQRVKTMLKQAGVLDEVCKASNKQRVKEDFDSAMEIIEEHGVCDFWDYNSDDLKEVAFGASGGFARGGFETWLDVRVEAVPPPTIAQAMKELARTKKRYRKNAEANRQQAKA